MTRITRFKLRRQLTTGAAIAMIGAVAGLTPLTTLAQDAYPSKLSLIHI